MSFNGNVYGFNGDKVGPMIYGWGQSFKSLPKWLTDAGCTFAINVDRQVKALSNPNSPFINPLVDVVGKLGKNLFDPLDIFPVSYDADFWEFDTVANENYYFRPNLNLNTNYVLSMKAKTLVGTNKFRARIYFQDATFLDVESSETIGLSEITATIQINISKPLNYIWLLRGSISSNKVYVRKDTFQLEPGTVATTYEPYGFNNVLLQSFAGTTADGYTQIALPNGKNPWFLKFDGSDSYGIMANTAGVDILGTNDFAISLVFRTPDTLNNGYIICKNGSTGSDQQYALQTQTDGRLTIYLATISINISLAGSLLPNSIYELLVIRKSGILTAKLNKIETYNLANTANLLTQPNLRIGARSSNVGGTTHSTLTNINLGNLAIFYNGATGLDIAKVEKAVAKLNANYI